MYEGVRKDAAENDEGRDHRQRTGIFRAPPCPDEIIRMAVQRFSPKRLGEERCIALSSASAEDVQQGGITGSNRFCPPRFSAVFGKKGRARAEGRNASGGGGRLQGPEARRMDSILEGGIQVE